MKIAIAGGAGYTGGELIRLLVHHPKIELVQVLSNSQAGKWVSDIHMDLKGQLDLKFEKNLTSDYDCIFLCMGHGRSGQFLEDNPIDSEKLVIDLSNEFRFASDDHDFIYGLPEWQKQDIAQSNRIANPGCFATSIQLGLLPLAEEGSLQSDIHITSITGSTGAGQSLSAKSHFSWRNNNVSIYKLFSHQHIPEVYQSSRAFQKDFDSDIFMVPMRGNFTRGILTSMYLDYEKSEEHVIELYKKFYANHPFVHIVEQDIDLKLVVNTNNCFIKLERFGNKLHITSIIDNLIKGASGQAIQNMNIVAGWPEDTGLQLKSSAF
ncbi:N-acetyl-gamma-glutamyl-phosphate reductase [Membranihabitans marinus]|uniref:N-acetyl-gamma-glutamyl-phosphate reductase n=1 Tax=Membranihabitans marinus TaxID=1227546 RepID=UPI001EFF70CD|nr:N-acetyl-gamma-glutamyl-phosphate reductase [Membranihabitans marinus]